MKFLPLLFACLVTAINFPDVFRGEVLERQAIENMFSRAFTRIEGSMTRNGRIDANAVREVEARFMRGRAAALQRLVPGEASGAPIEAVEREMTRFLSEFANFLENYAAREQLAVEIGLIPLMEAEILEPFVRRRLLGGRKRYKSVSVLREANVFMTEAEEAEARRYLKCVGERPDLSDLVNCRPL